MVNVPACTKWQTAFSNFHGMQFFLPQPALGLAFMLLRLTDSGVPTCLLCSWCPVLEEIVRGDCKHFVDRITQDTFGHMMAASVSWNRPLILHAIFSQELVPPYPIARPINVIWFELINLNFKWQRLSPAILLGPTVHCFSTRWFELFFFCIYGSHLW